MQKIVLSLASIFGALAVGIGAFGAHAWKPYLQQIQRLDTFETAVKYHFYHTLALLALGFAMEKLQGPGAYWAAICFSAGIVIFSGSLYTLCATNVGKWGAVTPIGGLFFIAGWVILLWTVQKSY